MKIAFDAKRYFYNKTGLGNYSRMAITALNKYHTENNYYLCNSKLIKDINNLSVLIPSSFLNKKISSLYRSYGVTNELIQNRIDIYHGLSNELPINIKKAKLKSFVTIHDLIFVKYPHLFPFIDRKIYEYKFRNACIQSDYIIATSLQTRNDIMETYRIKEDKIKVIYQAVEMKIVNEIDINTTVEKFQLPDNYLLYVGRIEERKNLLGILKAINKLNDKSIKLVVIGKEDKVYASQCLSYIKDNNLVNQVKFINNISAEELSAVYSKAMSLVYVSLYEGFGIPIVEAQLQSCCVITNQTGCFREVAADAALYVDVNSSDSISDAIQKIYSNQSFRAELISKGLQNSKRFTSKKFADQLIEAYLS